MKSLRNFQELTFFCRPYEDFSSDDEENESFRQPYNQDQFIVKDIMAVDRVMLRTKNLLRKCLELQKLLKKVHPYLLRFFMKYVFENFLRHCKRFWKIFSKIYSETD